MDKPALVISCIILNVRFCSYFGIISKPFNKLHSCAQSLRMSSYYSSSGFHAEDSFTVWHSFKLKCQASFPKFHFMQKILWLKSCLSQTCCWTRTKKLFSASLIEGTSSRKSYFGSWNFVQYRKLEVWKRKWAYSSQALFKSELSFRAYAILRLSSISALLLIPKPI